MIDLATMLTLSAALGAGALAKGATGMGLPLVAIPPLAAVFGLPQAIGIMLVPTIVTNCWQLFRFRAVARGEALRFLPPFLGLGLGGIAAGTWALGNLPERSLLAALGLLLLAYAVLRLARPGFRVGAATARRAGGVVGAAAGALHGATGLSAPVGVTFIHAMSLERPAHVFAVSAMFLAFSAAQLPALAIAGILEPAWLLQGAFALVPVAIFMPLGDRLGRIASRETFDRIILAFLAVMGVSLLFGG